MHGANVILLPYPITERPSTKRTILKCVSSSVHCDQEWHELLQVPWICHIQFGHDSHSCLWSHQSRYGASLFAFIHPVFTQRNSHKFTLLTQSVKGTP